MSDSITPTLPQNHEVFIDVAEPNEAHPEQSTLVLNSTSFFEEETSETIDVNQGNTKAVNSGDSIGVKPGDTVTWIVKASGITSILVMDDNRRANVFESNPSPVFGGINWSGVVDRSIVGRKVETYSICWSQNGKVYCYDPKIVVNP
jgi:plastocyanin